MKIEVVRIASKSDFTLGALYINGKFECFTLEDEKRTEKVWGETRIPTGTYKIALRTEGGFHARYLKKFGSQFHKGMLHVLDVPNFKHILIHIGNDDDDTAGCLLVGRTADATGFIGHSTQAYKQLYRKVLAALEKNEEVTISYIPLG